MQTALSGHYAERQRTAAAETLELASHFLKCRIDESMMTGGLLGFKTDDGHGLGFDSFEPVSQKVSHMATPPLPLCVVMQTR
jgi:hypothetical protein